MRFSRTARASTGLALLAAALLAVGLVLHSPEPAEANGFTVIALYDMDANACGVAGDVEGAGEMMFRQAESGAMHLSCIGSFEGPDLPFAIVADTDCPGVGGRVTLTPSKRFSFTCTYPPDPV